MWAVTQSPSGAYWKLTTDGTLYGDPVVSSDNDGGMYSFTGGSSYNETARFYTGKIATSSTDFILSFDYFNYYCLGNLTVSIKPDNTEWEELACIEIDDYYAWDWETVNIDLEAYSDAQYIQIAFDASCNKYSPIYIDNFKISGKSGVNEVKEDGENAGVEAIYNLQGMKVSGNMGAGIYIVRKADGTSSKVIIK